MAVTIVSYQAKSLTIPTPSTAIQHSQLLLDDILKGGGTESEIGQVDVNLRQDSGEDTTQLFTSDPYGKDAGKEKSERFDPSTTEVNMEATIDPDDVLKAGGFGARDDLSSLLPVASDSTDFEASLLDARDYEEPQGQQLRPGLGWSEDSK